MSPKRGDRVTVPPPDGEWDVRFGTSDAVRGWEELCRLAVANTRRCLEALRAHRAWAPTMTASTGCAETWPLTGTTGVISSSGSTR